MFDHLSLDVRDFSKSLAFYSKALAPLGHEAQFVDEKAKSAGVGPTGAPALWLAEKTVKSGPFHVAFRAAKRTDVDAFYEAALKAGGKDNGKPGLRADYSPTYYAAFVIDPDGNNVEAVTFAE